MMMQNGLDTDAAQEQAPLEDASVQTLRRFVHDRSGIVLDDTDPMIAFYLIFQQAREQDRAAMIATLGPFMDDRQAQLKAVLDAFSTDLHNPGKELTKALQRNTRLIQGLTILTGFFTTLTVAIFVLFGVLGVL